MRKILNWIKENRRNKEEGAVLIIVAFFIIILLVFAAFALDFGMVYYRRSQLQNVVDSSARSASRIMADEDKQPDKELRKEACLEEINKLFRENGIDPIEAGIDVNFIEKVRPDGKVDIEVDIDAKLDVEMGFAKVLDINTLPAKSGGAAVTEVTVIEGKKATVDVVFVLDLSSSMFRSDNTYTQRFIPMVEAVNNCIDLILKENPENRIGIVTYSNTNNGNEETGVRLKMTNDPENYRPVNDLYTSFVPNYLGYKGESINTKKDNAQKVYLYTKDHPNGFKYDAGGTYIQYGIAQGCRLLWDTANNDYDKNHRFPAVFILTDGEATLSNDKWNSFNTDVYKKTTDVNYVDYADVVSYNTVRTAMYWKELLTEKYTERNGEETQCKFYTLGFKLDLVDIARDDIAEGLLNPESLENKYNLDGNARKLLNKLRLTGEEYKYNDKYYDASEGKDIKELLEEFANDVVEPAKYYNTKLTK